MKRLLATSLLTVLTVYAVCGQSVIKEKINTIKKQSDIYFYDQYAHSNADTARVKATEWVLLSVNNGRTPDQELTYEAVAPYVKHLVMTSGGVTRDFAYVKKSDLPANTAITPTPQPSPTPRPVPAPERFVPDMFVQKLMEQKNFQSVHRYLRALMADGQVRMFGPLSQVEDNSSLDLIVFDLNTQQIITLLSPVTAGGTRVNLTTGAADSLDNYPEDMVAVIWYIKD